MWICHVKGQPELPATDATVRRAQFGPTYGEPAAKQPPLRQGRYGWGPSTAPRCARAYDSRPSRSRGWRWRLQSPSAPASSPAACCSRVRAGQAIELVSGATRLRRLSAEARNADLERVERVERRATWASAALLILLWAYLAATSIIGLVIRMEPEGSGAGLAISAAAVIVMPLLAWRKRVANRTIQSSALRADIVETISCAYMAGATLVGVALSTVLGWWWAEYVAALALLIFIGREAWEALEAAREVRDAPGP